MPLPLVAIPPPKRHSLFDAALEARRALCVLEAPGAAPSECEMGAARHRVLTQLASVAQCLEAMAETGLLHTNLNSQRTMQTSAHQAEPDGEWTAETVVTRVPPRPMITAKWSPELCRAAMLGSVVLDVVARDHRRELVEYRELAAVLADAWPAPDAWLAERFVDEWEHWGARPRLPQRTGRRWPVGQGGVPGARAADGASVRLFAAAGGGGGRDSRARFRAAHAPVGGVVRGIARRGRESITLL